MGSLPTRINVKQQTAEFWISFTDHPTVSDQYQHLPLSTAPDTLIGFHRIISEDAKNDNQFKVSTPIINIASFTSSTTNSAETSRVSYHKYSTEAPLITYFDNSTEALPVTYDGFSGRDNIPEETANGRNNTFKHFNGKLKCGTFEITVS